LSYQDGVRADAVDRSVYAPQSYPPLLADLRASGHDRIASGFQPVRPASGPESPVSRTGTGRPRFQL